MRAVVGSVDDECVVGDAEIVEYLEQFANVAVVLDHAISVFIVWHPAGVDGTHAPDHAGGEILLDAIGRSRRRCAQEAGVCTENLNPEIVVMKTAKDRT
jgi:hypothetical protein